MLTTTAYRVYSIYHRLARSETLALCVCVCLLFVCTRTQPSLWVTFTRHRRVALLRAPVYFHRASFRPRAAWCMLVGFMIRTDTTDADSYICRRCHRAWLSACVGGAVTMRWCVDNMHGFSCKLCDVYVRLHACKQRLLTDNQVLMNEYKWSEAIGFMRLCLTPPRTQSTTLCLQIVIKIIHTCGKQLCDSPRKPAYADDDAMMSTRVQWPLYSAHRVDWYTKIDSVFWARSGPCKWHHHQVHTPRKRIDANVVRHSNHSFIDLWSCETPRYRSNFDFMQTTNCAISAADNNRPSPNRPERKYRNLY